MKIRSGFVSNSSSTSFLIITKDKLNKKDFFELMGVALDSPISGLFAQLYSDLIENARTEVNFKTANEGMPLEMWFSKERLSERMIEKLREAKERGLMAYYGSLDSETNPIQTFFCTDSFEVENDKIYFNGLESAW
ncbi:MAG: hypothetical protein ACJ71Q_19850 [Terriglobales bacterium]